MKRILLLAMVAALMSVMLVVSAAPGFAHQKICKGGSQPQAVVEGTNGDTNGDGIACKKYNHKTDEYVLTDNHTH